jgi:hypothetical protein
LLQNPHMGVQEMVSGHPQATLERIRTQAVVLPVPDAPLLHDGTPPPKAGLGTVKSNTRAASLLPPTVALSCEVVCEPQEWDTL